MPFHIQTLTLTERGRWEGGRERERERERGTERERENDIELFMNVKLGHLTTIIEAALGAQAIFMPPFIPPATIDLSILADEPTAPPLS
jgi:hypothetical protein